jgi:quercetin dioxygenase-like cupin family protein
MAISSLNARSSGGPSRNRSRNFIEEVELIRNRLLKFAFLAVSVALPAVVLTGAAAAQEAPKFVVNKVAEKPLAALPSGDLYWTAETFSTLDAAKAAETDTAVAVEIDGVAWLLTLGPVDNVGHGGRLVASIGPIDRFDAPSYLLRINVSDAPPGTKTSIHSHPGSEAMYVMSGEVTVNWPGKTSVIKAGEGSPGQPPHTPMLAASTGDGTLKELIMFLVDPSQDFSRPATMN